MAVCIYLKDLFGEYLSEKEMETFPLWAFGKDYIDYSHALTFMNAWNELHGDCLMLHEDSCVFDDSPKMVDLWRKRDNNA